MNGITLTAFILTIFAASTAIMEGADAGATVVGVIAIVLTVVTVASALIAARRDRIHPLKH